jgi:hypothetical protein
MEKYKLIKDKDGSYKVINNETEMYVDRDFKSKDAAQYFIDEKNIQIKKFGRESYFKRGGALQSYTTAELAADLGITKRQMEVNKYDRDDLIALAEQQGLMPYSSNKTCYTIGGL